MIVSTVLLGLAAVLLMLVPTVVFAGSALIWKIRGGTNVASWAMYDGVAAFVITAVTVLATAPFIIWPAQLGYDALSLIPVLAGALIWWRLGNSRQRMQKVIAYFLELRAARNAPRTALRTADR